VYNLVNLFVKPSGFIQTAMYVLLTVVLVVSVFYLYAQPLLLLPLICVLAFYFLRLNRNQFIYQRHRLWQIKQGQVYQLDSDTSLLGGEAAQHLGLNATKVTIKNLQVWRALVLFTYTLNAKTHHEIISIDAVDQEAFRQFRCMIKRLT